MDFATISRMLLRVGAPRVSPRSKAPKPAATEAAEKVGRGVGLVVQVAMVQNQWDPILVGRWGLGCSLCVCWFVGSVNVWRAAKSTAKGCKDSEYGF